MSKSKRKIASYTGRRSRSFSVRDLTRVALMTAILAVCGWITIPLPEPMVPFTLQTFGVFLCLLILGGRDGTLAIAAYLLLGAVGAPVFSSFRGGLGVLLGSTGGYLTGFLAMGLLYWALTARGRAAPSESSWPAPWGSSSAMPSAPPGSWPSTSRAARPSASSAPFFCVWSPTSCRTF